jgi:hypothetical protein
MTPKEKAKELVYKFYPSVQWKLGQENCLDRAKQCALIAIDEFLSIENIKPYILHKEIIKFYIEVKQEIEKI